MAKQLTITLDDEVYDKLCARWTMDEIHDHLTNTVRHLGRWPTDEQMEESARQQALYEEDNPDLYANDIPDDLMVGVNHVAR